MQELSPRGNLIGFAVCAVPMTWLSIVAVRWWLKHPGAAIPRLFQLGIEWMGLLILGIPLFLMLAVRERRRRQILERKLAELQAAAEARLVELRVEGEAEALERRLRLNQFAYESERQIARGGFFRL